MFFERKKPVSFFRKRYRIDPVLLWTAGKLRATPLAIGIVYTYPYPLTAIWGKIVLILLQHGLPLTL